MSTREPIPPPLPVDPPPAKRKLRAWQKALLVSACLPALLAIAAVVLRITGVWQHYRVPTGAMSPAIKPGDQVFVTQLDATTTPLTRGTIIVFRTEGIPQIRQSTYYTQRVAGLPGERIEIQRNRVVANGVAMPLHNAGGEIVYQNHGDLNSPAKSIQVPADCCFVLGDNSADSFDSRSYGPIPLKAIVGRVRYCYLPRDRAGEVK